MNPVAESFSSSPFPEEMAPVWFLLIKKLLITVTSESEIERRKRENERKFAHIWCVAHNKIHIAQDHRLFCLIPCHPPRLMLLINFAKSFAAFNWTM